MKNLFEYKRVKHKGFEIEIRRASIFSTPYERLVLVTVRDKFGNEYISRFGRDVKDKDLLSRIGSVIDLQKNYNTRYEAAKRSVEKLGGQLKAEKIIVFDDFTS
jgi:hypothetical protein